MKTAILTLITLIALAPGCARSKADRAEAYSYPEEKGAAEQRSDIAPEKQTDETLDDKTAGRPLTISGVYLDAELVEACEINIPPKAYFEFDSADLDLNSNQTLSEVATCLTTGPLSGRKVELVGHTDPRGTDAYNKELGRSRAESVREFLLSQGLPSTSLMTRSVGERDAETAEPSDWAYERRVDIRLLPAD